MEVGGGRLRWIGGLLPRGGGMRTKGIFDDCDLDRGGISIG